MPIPLDAPEVLNREFLEVRARLLHLAAALDRLGGFIRTASLSMKPNSRSS